MEKFTAEETLNIIDELRNNLLDNINFNIGDYEGEPFIIVESWEDLTAIGAAVNGYRGNLDLAVVWNFENLNEEFNKAEAELIKTRQENPNHLGTISRLERRLKQLNNLANYKQWLLVNEIEEKELGVEIGFSDEYTTCCHCCNNVVRTSPDSYSWTPPLFLDSEGYVCSDCAGNFTEEVKEQYKNEAKSLPEDFTTEELGLVQVNSESFENGLYGGQLDEPKPIIEALNNEGIDCWFRVYPRQFDCSFDVYVEEQNLDKAIEVLNGTNTKAKEDPAVLCERALRQASSQMAELEGEGIKYSKINADGTATTRLVSDEEFIKGIKD